MDQGDVRLDMHQVETCVAHFVHLLAHHPALSTADGIDAVAAAVNESGGGSMQAADVVALTALVKAKNGTTLKEWASGIGRQGLLKGMADQMDFLLKALFEGQPNMENAPLINAILRTIHGVRCAGETARLLVQLNIRSFKYAHFCFALALCLAGRGCSVATFAKHSCRE